MIVARLRKKLYMYTATSCGESAHISEAKAFARHGLKPLAESSGSGLEPSGLQAYGAELGPSDPGLGCGLKVRDFGLLRV